MRSKIVNNNGMAKLKKFIISMAFKHQATVDLCTWGILYSNKLIEDAKPIIDQKIYEVFLDEKHEARIEKHNAGPLLYYKDDDCIANGEIAYLVFTEEVGCRRAVYNYFLNMQIGKEIGDNTVEKIKKTCTDLFTDKWVKSAVFFCDLIKSDWLCNLSGLIQAVVNKDQKMIQEYAPEVFRPSIAAAESSGTGVLQPSYDKEKYLKEISMIENYATDIEVLLDDYFFRFGHIPLCYEESIYSSIDNYFEKNPASSQDKWDSMWGWADKINSPLARFHICCYFIRKIENVPEVHLPALYDELLNIMHFPKNEEISLTWTSAWRIRCDLAKHFGQYLESRLPGANTEKLYTQAWWMAEKIASVYGNNTEDIAAVREYTIKPEEDMSHLIWQMLRSKMESSSLRYATLLTNSLWAISNISQIDKRFIDYVCKNELKNKDLFVKSILGFYVSCFPLKSKDDSECVYAYDKTCSKAAESLSELYDDGSIKEQFKAFLSAVNGLSDKASFLNHFKNFHDRSDGDQLLLALAFRVMVYTDLIEDDNEIWEVVCNEEWIKNTFLLEGKEQVIDTLIISLMEIILQKHDRWAWELPHLFSLVLQNNIENPEIKRLAFACVVISSICSETSSALERTLIKNAPDVEDLRGHWRGQLISIYNIAPETARGRLRPILLCLS